MSNDKIAEFIFNSLETANKKYNTDNSKISPERDLEVKNLIMKISLDGKIDSLRMQKILQLVKDKADTSAVVLIWNNLFMTDFDRKNNFWSKKQVVR